ncbi:NAD-dependent epimerase/dehydratase family protein [Polymorphobacter fuscus]|uniref:NAD-dependent epimerase/dehydratase family protein n=1 Tax=Sandarakinorhabdus fusca TaxID=1439888 RepID=UPI0016B71440|nr:NAD(P)-dependent oxidoreductase [Polymorphobacter fuscus]NJC09942.1 dTDP-6-deoxy-L-talose 4-dehydrogenase (NAD+) [Polymorphobacter fuscus]
MKIAVTGASGFVGRHVISALASMPDTVVTASSRRRVPVPAGVDHVAMDLGDADTAFERLGSPDVVIHLAWEGLPNYRDRRHFEVELPAQYRFLKALVTAGLPSLVVAGTCYEYGMASGCLKEDFEGQPSNPYGFAKLMLLRQLQFLKVQLPFSLSWARLFYMWGEGQAPSSLYPLLAAAAARGDPTFPMSGGEQLRDYLPVKTVAHQLVALARAGADAGVVNICSGEPVAIRTLVERWIAENGWPITPDLGKYPYPDYEPLAFWGSNKRLRSDLATVIAISAGDHQIFNHNTDKSRKS